MTERDRRAPADAARLEQANSELDAQVKLLVRTEQRLCRSQAELDQQVLRLAALNELALQCAGAPEDVTIGRAVDLLTRQFAVDEVLALRGTPTGQGVTFASAAGCDSGAPAEDDAVSARLATLDRVIVLRQDGDPAHGLGIAEVRRWLSVQARMDCGRSTSVVLIPLRLAEGPPVAIIAVAAGAAARSFHLEPPGEKHLSFLQLLGRHVERELANARLTADLRLHATALRDANEKLRASLDELSATQAQLIQTSKMEALGRLAGGIAHDFNNLLTVIRGHADLMARAPALPDDARTAIPEIQRAAEHATRLTRQLLAFGRKQARQVEVLSLNALIREMAPMLRSFVGEGIAVELGLDPGVPNVRADRAQVEQVLLNLAANARDAMGTSGRLGIRTRVVAAPAMLSRRGEDAGGAEVVAITVSDTGHGMDEQTRARVFEPFFTTKPPGEGTGMGLAMVHGIVDQHHGCITVESTMGEGTRFTIFLPATREAATRDAAATTLPETPEPAATVLLVEDEQAIRSLCRRVLESAGYTVVSARNGQEALAVLPGLEQHIDLVLSDVVMPKMGGVEMVRRLRATHPDVKVVFMSGYAGSTLSEHDIIENAGHYLAKPFTAGQLLEQVHRALAQKA